MNKTLKEAMPSEFMGCEYENTYARKLVDRLVVEEHGIEDRVPWPGKQKNVCFWVVVEGNIAVGWNENPSIGWSFPTTRIKR